MDGILGKKVGMTQVFADDGAMIPVTVIEAGPCLVVQRKTADTDGYDAVQVGLVEKRTPRHVTKPLQGHFKKAGVPPTRRVAEFQIDAGEARKAGDEIKASIFAAGEYVDVVGTSKGKGFQGVVKRHGFRGGRATHGSMFHRAPGSIGASSFPSRVYPGHARRPGGWAALASPPRTSRWSASTPRRTSSSSAAPCRARPAPTSRSKRAKKG